MPQLSPPPVFNDLSPLQMRRWGMGKQTSPFFHPLYLSLTSFLTFLPSLTFLCRNISPRAVTLLAPLGLRAACEMCRSHHRFPLGTGSLQLSVRWEKISLGRHTGWAGGRQKCSNSTKDRCCLHTMEPLEAKRTVSTKGVSLAPPSQFRDSLKLSLRHI